MPTSPTSSLHIEHRISSLATWTAAFNSFAAVRRQAGVIGEAVRVLHDDDQYVVIDLEFDTTEHAQAFLHFLQTQIWTNPANSPALVGMPEARVLELVHRA